MKGRIIVHFGSTYESAQNKVLNPLTEFLKDDYTLEVYTSNTIRRKLKEKGIEKKNFEEAILDMEQNNITEVEVIPTFLIDGIEFDKIKAVVDRESEKGKIKYTLRKPFIYDDDSAKRLSDAVSKVITREVLDKGIDFLDGSNLDKKAILVCGHGTLHNNDHRYQSFCEKLEEDLNIKVIPANMEGSNSFEETVSSSAFDSIEEVLVIPLMMVFGDHGHNDILGDEDSLKSLLEERKIKAHFIDKGLGEFDEVRALLSSGENYMKSPMGIENRSMEIIREELKNRGFNFNEEEFPIISRIIHTTGDPDYFKYISMDNDFRNKALDALKNGAKIYCDTNMIVSGINKAACKKLNVEPFTYISDERVRETASREGITRSMAGIDLAVSEGVTCFAFGNAPTALYRLLEHVKNGKVKPDFIIGIPVGFVGASESKSYLGTFDIPQIRINGTRGGSNIVVSVINALLYELGGR